MAGKGNDPHPTYRRTRTKAQKKDPPEGVPLYETQNPGMDIHPGVAGEEGFEPSAYGFGDRRSAN